MEYEYYGLTCGKCGHEFTVRANIERGFSDHEDVDCPKCGEFVANIRADMGYEIIKD